MNIKAPLFRLTFRIGLSAVAVCAAALVLVGCQKVDDGKTPAVANAAPAPTTGDKGTTPTPAADTSAPPTQPPTPPNANDAQAALNTIVGGRVFPTGTKLQNLTIVDGVATLDFSPEFNKIKTMGESSESELQKTLRKALAKIEGVRTMRVLVDGKPFESEITDWSAIPVRDTEEARDSGSPGGQQ